MFTIVISSEAEKSFQIITLLRRRYAQIGSASKKCDFCLQRIIYTGNIMTEQEKEQYAAVLAAKVEMAVKILKIVAIAAVVVALVLGIYSFAVLPKLGDGAAAIGVAVAMLGVLILLVVAVFAIIIYAYITFNKLKKLK